MVGADFEKRDREGVTSRFQFLAATDLVSLLDRRSGSEVSLQTVFGNLMLGGVGEQNDSGFVVLALP